MLQKQIYDVFIGFEERAADIYLDLAVRFVNNVDLSWFWVEMAMEEKQHAGLLQYCRETDMLCARMPETGQIQRLGGLFKELSARAHQPGVTLDEALDIAIALEGSEINDIYDNLTANVEGPWHILRKKVELSTHDHFEKIREAAVRFGAAASIQAKLAALAKKETTRT